jgi:hypothetical protein
MLELEIRQAMQRYEDRLREADEYRLSQLAVEANGRSGYLRKRIAARVGIWMITVGRRLEAQDGRLDPSPAPRYVRVPQQPVAQRSTVIDCGAEGKLVIDGPIRRVA